MKSVANFLGTVGRRSAKRYPEPVRGADRWAACRSIRAVTQDAGAVALARSSWLRLGIFGQVRHGVDLST